MAKTNYGEMEKSISRTLKKYKRDELLVQADEAQKELKSKKKNETRLDGDRGKMRRVLQRRRDRVLYQKLRYHRHPASMRFMFISEQLLFVLL